MRALLKPEAVFEIESGHEAFRLRYHRGVAGAHRVVSSRAEILRNLRFLRRADDADFPFDANMHWPNEFAGRRMQTYHEWMNGMGPITMSGCPALAAPAGFNDRGLPAGIQIVAPNRAELACLQLAYGYDAATQWRARRRPALLDGNCRISAQRHIGEPHLHALLALPAVDGEMPSRVHGAAAIVEQRAAERLCRRRGTRSR